MASYPGGSYRPPRPPRSGGNYSKAVPIPGQGANPMHRGAPHLSHGQPLMSPPPTSVVVSHAGVYQTPHHAGAVSNTFALLTDSHGVDLRSICIILVILSWLLEFFAFAHLLF